MIWALHGAFGALTDWHGVQHALEHLGGPTETQWGLVDLWEQAAGAFSLDETATVLADGLPRGVHCVRAPGPHQRSRPRRAPARG